jgi:ubiquinol oxidase
MAATPPPKDRDDDDSGVRSAWPRPGHAYGWIDAEAEALIAKAYKSHKALVDTGRSMPPSLSVADLERLEVPTHYPPEDFTDRLAYGFMKFMRVFVHGFFRQKYDHHAVCLETVAAVPGIVAAFHRHLRSLRRMKRDHGYINVLLEESENERMHLLIWMKVTQPTPVERGIVVLAQGVYLTFYSFLYMVAPRAAHRLTGYLEEEAHAAYTQYLSALDSGALPLKPAPDIAKEYYRLPEDSTVRDVVLYVRADECCHREINHGIANKYKSGDSDSPPTPLIFANEIDERERVDGGNKSFQ